MSKPTLSELEHALMFSAFLVERYGERAAPVMDRLERELEERRANPSSQERARRIMNALSKEISPGRQSLSAS